MASDSKPDHAAVTGYPCQAPPVPSCRSSTVYAYPAPPQPASYPPFFSHSAYPNAAAAGYAGPTPDGSIVFRRIVLFCISFFLFSLVFSFIVWITVSPGLPTFSVASVDVSGFNLTLDPQQISATFVLTLTVQNPNTRSAIYYDRVWAGVYHGADGDSIADVTLPPFVQEPNNTTTVTAHFVAADAYMDSYNLRVIDAGWSRGGGAPAIDLRFNFIAWTMQQSGVYQMGWRPISVQCDDIQIAFKNARGADGSIVDSSPRTCSVNA